MIIFTGDCELAPDTGKFTFEIDCRDGDADARRLLDLMTEIIAKGLMGPGVSLILAEWERDVVT